MIKKSSLKNLSGNTIPGIEEVNTIKENGSLIHFNNPKAKASLAGNTFAITGHGENKQITEILPGISNQLGPEELNQLKRLASAVEAVQRQKLLKRRQMKSQKRTSRLVYLVDKFFSSSVIEEYQSC
ncbi:hypothetical protein WA026_009953 [Henosepilachna vigintioctopunctata]|uniref:Transcription factor BTF3 n=1 Tax=Henosepilachna vigintioctopunctata TaxID=420089 RepID=A0AAW1TSE9_9CUCU